MTAHAAPRAVLRARGLTKRYASKAALSGIDLTLDSSGVVAVLGPNGAGKSTLVHCALGLTRPSSGAIEIFGNAPGRMSSRQRTGVMLQDADLPDLLTPREHIALFASYYPDPMPAQELIQLCDMHAFVDRRYKKLSGGQKRRVQFALAIVGRPELIFLDEPTTGLDLDARNVVWAVVRSLSAQGKTIVLTSHYLEEADALADRIVVLRAGRVIADAPAREIRETVGGALIRCVSALPDQTIAGLACVASLRRHGRFVSLLSQDATATLKALLAADPNITDLSVKKPDLEEAFTQLTGTEAQAQSS